MSTDNLKWPAGYCLDPSGKMCAPEEAGPHFDFGYEIGFREAMAIKMRAIAADRAARAEPPGWQPIETAPIDREDVLLWTPSGALVGYCYVRGKWHASGVKASDEGCDVELYEAPTNWMPLPAAPEPKPAGETR